MIGYTSTNKYAPDDGLLSSVSFWNKPEVGGDRKRLRFTSEPHSTESPSGSLSPVLGRQSDDHNDFRPPPAVVERRKHIHTSGCRRHWLPFQRFIR